MANSNIARAVRLALVAASAAGACAYVPAASAQEPELEQVVVTGSRIARPDFEGDSPVVSVGDAALKNTGTNSLATMLNQLPQFVPSVSNTSNNPSNGGQSNIDLRGLGTNRNLVLMDGRRLPASNSDGTVDVNIIPTALLQRVEVVTGGASAVYGSDAIAGVTNFVMKDRFEGVQVDGGYTVTGLGDANEYYAQLALGGNFADDRGNGVFSFGYTSRDAVLQGARKFSRISYNVRKQGLTGSGSSTIEQGRANVSSSNGWTQAAVDTVFGSYGYAPGTVGKGQNISFNPDGTLFSTGKGTPGSVTNFRGIKQPGFSDTSFTYNFAPINLMQLPLERYNLFTKGTFDITDSVTAYGQAIYTTYHSKTQLAPVPATGLTVAANNPYIPADLKTLLNSRANPNADFGFRKRMTGVGPRTDDNTYDVYQFLVGLKGTFGESYNWDIYGSQSKVKNVETLGNDISLGKMSELLHAPDGGMSICGMFNPFGMTGISKSCADYVAVYFTNTTTNTMNTVEGTIGGKLMDLPAGEAKFSVGADYRGETFDFTPDYQVATGDLLGFNQQNPLAGKYNVQEGFVEAYFPLVKDAPFAQSIDVTVGGRYSDYSSIGAATSWEIQGNWQVVDSVRLRGSYQSAIRAPSIGELFAPQDQDFPALLEDPCNVISAARTYGPNADVANGGNDAIRNLCIAQGIPATDVDDYNNANTQVETFGGGNPNLKEETSDSWTLGVVLKSPFENELLSNMQLSIDYYSIKLTDAIFSLPAGEIVLLCYGYNGNNPSADPNDPACKAINRMTPGKGTDPPDPWVPNAGTTNIGKLDTAGVDVQLDWGMDFGAAGNLNLNFLASYLDKYEVQYRPDLPTIDYKGTIGPSIGNAYPDYKLWFNGTYGFGPVDFGMQWRFVPSMDNRYASYDPTTVKGVGSVSYFDLDLAYNFNDTSSVTFGVINVGNEQPQMYTNSPQMNTDPSVYDVLGRRYYMNATVKF